MADHTVHAYYDGAKVVVEDEKGKDVTHCHPKETFVWCTKSASLSVRFKAGNPFSPASPDAVTAQSSQFVCDAPVTVTGSPGTYSYGVMVVTYDGKPHPMDPKVIIDPKLGPVQVVLLVLIVIAALAASVGIYLRSFRART